MFWVADTETEIPKQTPTYCDLKYTFSTLLIDWNVYVFSLRRYFNKAYTQFRVIKLIKYARQETYNREALVIQTDIIYDSHDLKYITVLPTFGVTSTERDQISQEN